MYKDTRDFKEKTLKRNVLRYNEYYQMTPTFDMLYKQSKEGSNFKHLYDIIASRENILLAYRKIKRNKGSKTAGTNGHKIKDWEVKNIDEYVSYIQDRLNNYIPQSIKRVNIPKSNGKLRPPGISCIEDRLIQQAIKQVLEPICEAKFYSHSYGFRPNRGVEQAIAYAVKKVNIDKCYYVINVDIKGFFDNVNHGKLLKQLWTIGIQDKKVISIISKMLKGEIKGIGKPEKGTPQGGILSPLLANVVLNELDWWISSQWENMKTRKPWKQSPHKYGHLRNQSKLKEMYIVRYADDFKIYCKTRKDAEKTFIAVKQWLKERLGLDINEEKSGITDIRRNSIEFLGFNLKAHKKNKKWTIVSYMTDKAKENVIDNIKKQTKIIQKRPNPVEIIKLNRIVAGSQDFYKIATKVSKDFKEINYKTFYCRKNHFKDFKTKSGYKSKEYGERYKGYKGKETFVSNQATYPVTYVQNRYPKVMKQKICNYTKEGRKLIHKELTHVNKEIMKYFVDNPLQSSVELNDNRISMYSEQNGKCIITNHILQEDAEVHHIKPISQGGTDAYKNLALMIPEAHKLIHATTEDTIKYYVTLLNLSKSQIKKVNKYRKYVGNGMIMSE